MKKMEIRNLLLLVLIAALPFAAHSAQKIIPQKKIKRAPLSEPCKIRSMQAHYSEEMALAGQEISFIQFESDLNADGTPEVFFAARESCGSRGCEYVVYQRTAQDCFEAIAEFTGHVSVLEEIQNGYKVIELNQRDGALSTPAKSRFVFDSQVGAYRKKN